MKLRRTKSVPVLGPPCNYRSCTNKKDTTRRTATEWVSDQSLTPHPTQFGGRNAAMHLTMHWARVSGLQF